MQDCIGAIDGTHVPMTISPNQAAPFRNRKKTISQNVMVACDFDLNFTFVSCVWEGSASDAGVLRSAISRGFQVPAGKFYLVDGGYGNTPSFLAPYPRVCYHLSELGGVGILILDMLTTKSFSTTGTPLLGTTSKEQLVF